MQILLVMVFYLLVFAGCWSSPGFCFSSGWRGPTWTNGAPRTDESLASEVDTRSLRRLVGEGFQLGPPAADGFVLSRRGLHGQIRARAVLWTPRPGWVSSTVSAADSGRGRPFTPEALSCSPCSWGLRRCRPATRRGGWIHEG